MTKALLSWVASVKVSFTTRLILLGLTLGILPFTVAVDALRLVIGGMRERQLLSSGSVRCSCGREVELYGGWRCSCGIIFEGNGFAKCPACGERSFISCPCSRSIKNPLRGSR